MKLQLTIRTESDYAPNLQVDTEQIIAIEESESGTRIHMITGTVFTVWETIETIEQYQQL